MRHRTLAAVLVLCVVFGLLTFVTGSLQAQGDAEVAPPPDVDEDTVCSAAADGCTWVCVTSDGFGTRFRVFNLCPES